MIEGPAAPATSGGPGPLRRFSFAKLWAKVRTIGTLLRRRALSAQAQPADRSDLFLWRLQLVDRVFWAVLAGLACYLVIDLTLLQPKPPTMLAALDGASSGAAAPFSADLRPVTVEDRLRPAHEYREALTNRNPFELAASAAARALVTQPAASKESPLQKLVSKLNVVGINRGRVPEALIEDTETRRTYFVTVGDRINDMKVKAIDDDGVVLTYQGEDVRLPL